MAGWLVLGSLFSFICGVSITRAFFRRQIGATVPAEFYKALTCKAVAPAMSGPRHEPEVIRAMAIQAADEVRVRMTALGFTAREAACMAMAAERDALERSLGR